MTSPVYVAVLALGRFPVMRVLDLQQNLVIRLMKVGGDILP